MSDVAGEPIPRACARQGAIELSSFVPAMAPAGDQIACDWRLTNRTDAKVAASLYLRSAPAVLVALTCPGARILRGHFHASVALVIAAGDTATVRAVVEPRAPGGHELRVALVTRSRVLARIDIMTVSPSRGRRDSG
jgi:hypothetical protein